LSTRSSAMVAHAQARPCLCLFLLRRSSIVIRSA
jgi:hypothetical protein